MKYTVPDGDAPLPLTTEPSADLPARPSGLNALPLWAELAEAGRLL